MCNFPTKVNLTSSCSRCGASIISPPSNEVGAPRRPRWPELGYDVSDEIIDPTDWSINPDQALAWCGVRTTDGWVNAP